MVRGRWARGRSRFPLTDANRDYSGQDFRGLYLSASDGLSHSFLNGTNIDDCAFVDVRMDHVELAEAALSQTLFRDVVLAVTDLVRSNVTDVRFVRCDFANGEWRETQFERISFEDCTFEHTTINLCTFADCTFSGAGSLDRRSVNYNTFSRCIFESRIADTEVASRNFGLPVAIKTSMPVPPPSVTTLEQVCLLSGSGEVAAAHLIHAIAREAQAPAARLKKLRLEFIANIVRQMAAEHRLSPATLIYIEEILSRLAKSAQNESDFLAAMSALVTIRNALYRAAFEQYPEASAKVPCAGLILKFRSNFTKSQVEIFVAALSELVFGRPGDITVQSVRRGSTVAECLFSFAASAGTVLVAVNLLLSQANTLVQRLTSLRKSIQRYQRLRLPAPARSRSRPTRMNAILDPKVEAPQLMTLRALVQKNGQVLMLFDEAAEVTLIPPEERRQRRRQKV